MFLSTEQMLDTFFYSFFRDPLNSHSIILVGRTLYMVAYERRIC